MTDVNKAAQNLPTGSQLKANDGDIYTLGDDKKFRDKAGNALYQCGSGKVCSTKDFA
ncbi:MAG: hypothetical protein ACRD4V_06030 [Candidatus Acidiferrales bacterium]